MHSEDIDVLTAMVNWKKHGKKVTLVTVVKTWGSSPRPAGAMLAINEDGLVAGSVSGGCIEDDLIRQIRNKTLIITNPQSMTYGISSEEARKFGLPCGGSIQLVAENIESLSLVETTIKKINSGELFSRTLNIITGEVRLSIDSSDEFQFDGVEMIVPFGPRYRVLVIGAGQLSKFFSQIMLGLGFQVVVCDPREEYYDTWDVQGAILTKNMPDDVVLEMKPNARTAIVALTHDPKLDDMALLEALNTNAFYVAALGSRRNNAKRKERLKEHFDMSEESLNKLYGPAGIYIGSKIPSEIAVSIAAELIAAKNGVQKKYSQLADVKEAVLTESSR